MNARPFCLIGGCTGSYPVPFGDRIIYDPVMPSGFRREQFSRSRFGGNTTSFLVRCGNVFILVDHGLGVKHGSENVVRMLAAEGQKDATVFVLQTHYHTDHIQGTPQNQLLFRPATTLRYYSPKLNSGHDNNGGASMERIIGAYFRQSGEYFPVSIDQLPSRQEHVLFCPGDTLDVGALTVRTILLKHPGGSCGYRIEIPGSGALVIATDYEPGPDPDPAIVEFFDGARLLLVDMQYSDEEYAGAKKVGSLKMSRAGWGHGTPRRLFPTILQCPQLPDIVRIIHHDPEKLDVELDMFHEQSAEILATLAGGSSPINYGFARDGDVYPL